MSTKMNARHTNQVAKTAPSTSKSGNNLFREVKPVTDRPKSSQMGKVEATSNILHHKPLASEKNSHLDVKAKQTNTGIVKQKAIPIRHTLTSKLRMEKANPLLNSDLAVFAPKLPLAKLAPTPTRRSTFNPAVLRNKPKVEVKNSGTHTEKKTAIKKEEFVIQKTNAVNRSLMGNKSYASGSQTKMESAVERSIVRSKSSQEMSLNKATAPAFKTATIGTKSSVVSKPSGPASNHLQAKPPANKENLRILANKRLSAQNTFNKNITSQKMSRSNTQHFSSSSTNILQKKNVNSQSQILFTKSSVKNATKKQLKSILRKSLSTGDLQKLDAIDEDGQVLGAVENLPSVSAKTPTKSSKTVAFHSPLRNSSFSCASIAKTPSSLLRERLQNWLARQGNSSNSYRHLCCFGLPKNQILVPSNDNQSSRQESCLNDTITLESSSSMNILPEVLEADEDMNIENSMPKGSSTPEKEDNSEQNKENVAYLANPEALTDLKKLVHSGYPRDQCELWLGYICKVQPSVKELPEYWECLASLEEARGDFTSAVDCYGKAVVKGADAQDIDGCLDGLWEKFNSLSVSAVDSKATPLKKSAIDKKQIFKSTVIKFALQQKAIKKCSKEAGLAQNNVNYIVTPVRRSSRRSQSLFRTTPSIKCVDRLDDLELNIRDTMQFHCNTMLYPSD